jgi:regulator of protease activity HflC (stomatin/prohibitin superfamily)
VDGSRRIVTKRSPIIDLREQVLDFPKQSVITSDNVTMEIDAVLYYQVEDPKKAIYGISNVVDAIEKVVQTSLRNVTGELSLDESLASRDRINTRLRNILDEATSAWGVRVTRVELQEISPPAAIRERMELQMTAEREKRAEILRAEGKKQAAIQEAEGQAESELRRAEAHKQAQILEAEGIAQSRQLVAESEAEALSFIEAKVGKNKASDYLIAMKYLESLGNIADGNATKVFMPFEASGVLGSLASISDIFKHDKE